MLPIREKVDCLLRMAVSPAERRYASVLQAHMEQVFRRVRNNLLATQVRSYSSTGKPYYRPVTPRFTVQPRAYIPRTTASTTTPAPSRSTLGSTSTAASEPTVVASESPVTVTTMAVSDATPTSSPVRAVMAMLDVSSLGRIQVEINAIWIVFGIVILLQLLTIVLIYKLGGRAQGDYFPLRTMSGTNDASVAESAV